MTTLATGWTNCEYRSYQFADETGKDEEARLRETAESWSRRQGSQVAPTQEELQEMRESVQRTVLPLLNVKA